MKKIVRTIIIMILLLAAWASGYRAGRSMCVVPCDTDSDCANAMDFS